MRDRVRLFVDRTQSTWTSPLILKEITLADDSLELHLQQAPSSARRRPFSTSSTLAKAARQIGVRSGTLRILLRAEGNIREEKRKGSPIAVSRDDINRLTDEYSHSIAFSGLGDFLGVGRKIAERLRDNGEIPIWIPGGKHGTKHRYLFRLTELALWVDSLIGDAPLLDSIPEDCLTLADTPLRKHFPVGELVSAIRDGRVTVAGRLTNRAKFGGAILRAQEVDAAVPIAIRLRMGGKKPLGAAR